MDVLLNDKEQMDELSQTKLKVSGTSLPNLEENKDGIQTIHLQTNSWSAQSQTVQLVD